MTPRRRTRRPGPVAQRPGQRAALYRRVSTEDQAKEGFSLEAQLATLQAYCKQRAFTVAGDYVDDGYSGRTTSRPAYKRLLQEMDQWDVLVVVKMDRAHRNSRNFMALTELLAKEGKSFIMVNENWDTGTVAGRFAMDMMQRVAQLESEQIGERTVVAMTQKAKGGGSVGAKAPYGYRRGPDGKYVVEPDEAKVVRWIFSAFAEGSKLTAMADDLELDQTPGLRWGRISLRRLLENPSYAGHLVWGDVVRENDHPAIIEPPLWARAQNRLQQTARASP